MKEQQQFVHGLFLQGPCLFLLLSFVQGFTTVSTVVAQSENSASKPYATLDRQKVTYRGPVSAAESDVPGEAAVIGVILPLRAQQQAEGEAVLAAVQIALDEEQERGTLPDGRKLSIVARDESGPWGQASSEILKLIELDHALAVLTSANGNIAHQAEQIANKISFPILTLASDPTTTQTNVPWLFRLGPSDADQARIFGQRIYTELQFRKVLLVVQADHDGRVGRAEFEKVASDMKAPTPDVVELPPSEHGFEAVTEATRVKAPDAVVVWTDGTATEELISAIRRIRPMVPIFLSTKAAQLGTQSLSEGLCIASVMEDQGMGPSFTVASLPVQGESMQDDFERAYRTRTGASPGIAAFEAYKAVRLIAAGLRAAGANRILLRDYFASDGKFNGGSRSVPFDPAGNDIEEFALVTIATPHARPAVSISKDHK